MERQSSIQCWKKKLQGLISFEKMHTTKSEYHDNDISHDRQFGDCLKSPLCRIRNKILEMDIFDRYKI